MDNSLLAAFVIRGQRCNVTVEFRPLERNDSKRTVDLQPVPADPVCVAFCGEFDGNSGQCTEEIREAAENEPSAAPVLALCDLWGRWHMNDMRAGTALQRAALIGKGLPYEQAVTYLASIGLNPDRGYRYGSAWLYEPASAEDIATIRSAMATLDGARFGSVATPSEDGEPAELDECDIDTSADFFDSRDIIARIEYLTDFLADNPDHEEATEELAKWQAIDSECSGYGDWQHGETLIRDSYFTEYAQDFANDCGMVNSEARWPNNHIDWEAAAAELQNDYTSVEIDGETYWFRA